MKLKISLSELLIVIISSENRALLHRLPVSMVPGNRSTDRRGSEALQF
jgi:hypothetical protein